MTLKETISALNHGKAVTFDDKHYYVVEDDFLVERDKDNPDYSDPHASILCETDAILTEHDIGAKIYPLTQADKENTPSSPTLTENRTPLSLKALITALRDGREVVDTDSGKTWAVSGDDLSVSYPSGLVVHHVKLDSFITADILHGSRTPYALCSPSLSVADRDYLTSISISYPTSHILYIQKIKDSSHNDAELLRLTTLNDSHNEEWNDLPPFKAGTFFKYLALNAKYYPGELGL